ncbi:MAG TPA: TetR family transcriptional regulator [Gaiellaceae bacterium]|nr:TetR family transcriptional regulator [Gaiellaceae bacterium]
MSSEGSAKRSGRRPGPSTTREAIAEAARRQFAELGYDRATLRGIAGDAGVDAALVVRFYGSKDALFREVMALPPAVADAIAGLADGPTATVGRRLAQAIVGMLEDPRSRSVVLGRIRSASSHPDAAALVRETVTRDVGRLVAALTDDEPETRAVLVGSQIVGLALARHVVRVEPLASLPATDVVDYIAPVFQHYLVGTLRES